MYARGAIFGLTRDVNKNHIAKATLDSLAFQTKDVIDAMEKDAGRKIEILKVDGGAVANNYLMQFQSDILQTNVERPENIETTAMGAAFLAGLAIGWWQMEELQKRRNIDQVFKPEISDKERQKRYALWQRAIERTRNWLRQEESA